MIKFLKFIKRFFLLRWQQRKILRVVLNWLVEHPVLENGMYFFAMGDKPLLFKYDLAEFVLSKFSLYEEIPFLKVKIDTAQLNEKAYDGQLLMVSVNNDYKVFDYNKKIVLSICGEEKKEKLIENYSAFSQLLPLTYIDESKLGVSEKIIDYIPRKNWDKKTLLLVYQHVLDDLLFRIKNNNGPLLKEYNLSCLPPNFDSLDLFWKKLCNSANAVTNVLRISSHCDLHMNNILYDGEQIFYIDFEYARKEVFFYDIYNVLFVEFSDLQSTYLLDLFLNNDKRIDSILEKIFVEAKISFNSSTKKSCLYSFLRVRFAFDCFMANTRFADSQLENYKKYLVSRYSKFINYIEVFFK